MDDLTAWALIMYQKRNATTTASSFSFQLRTKMFLRCPQLTRAVLLCGFFFRCTKSQQLVQTIA